MATHRIKYLRRSGFATKEGQDFELKVATYLFMKGINSNEPFNLASNVNSAGDFDDIVFQYNGDKNCVTYLIQTKFKQQKGITTTSLLGTSGKFSLFSYLQSYSKIKDTKNSDLLQFGSFNSFKFVFYTSVNISGGENYSMNNKDTVLNTGGVHFSFSRQNHGIVFNTFEQWITFDMFLENILSILDSDKQDDEKRNEIRSKTSELNNTTEVNCIKEWLSDILQKDDEELLNIKDVVDKKIKETQSYSLELHEEFLKNLIFFPSQACGEDLDNKIKREIEIACNTSLHDTKKIFFILVEEIQKWWNTKGKTFCLNQSSKFWTDIVENQKKEIKQLSSEKTKELMQHQILFEKEEIDFLLDQLSSTQVLHIIPPESQLLLSCVKVSQALQDKCFIFTDMRTAQKHLASWKAKWCEYFVIEQTQKQSNIENLSQEIDTILKSDKNKKLILIGLNDFELSLNMKNGKKYSDQYNLTSLNTESQQLLLNKLVKFQGYEVPLKSLIGSQHTSKEVVCNDFLCNLANVEGNIIMIGSKLKKRPEYYISRTLNRRVLVKTDYIEKLLKDKSVIIDPLEKSISGVVQREDWIHRFCKEKSDKLVWKNSKRDIEYIYQYLDDVNLIKYNPQTLTDIEDRVVLIIAKPGMGKSTLMTHLALSTKENESGSDYKGSSTWIARVDLNSHRKFLEEINESDLENDVIIKFLEKDILKLESITEFKLFENSLTMEGNVVIIFDAYDEVPHKIVPKVSKIIKKISEVNKGKMWVTSRFSEWQNLERDLSSLSYGLQPFCEFEQHNFLLEVWKSKFPCKDRKLLQDFAMQLLQLTAQSLSDKEKKFTGVPLQTMMLAEVFQDNLNECIQTGLIRLPVSVDLLELYNEFVNKILCRYFEEKLKIEKFTEIFSLMEKQILNDFKNCALMSIFPTETLKNVNNFEKPEQFLSEKRNMGIIEFEDDKPHFLHHTFAEYFAADWLSKNFRDNKNFFIENVFKSNHDVLKNIFDRILARNKKLHKAVLNGHLHDLKKHLEEVENVNELDEGGRTALHIAVGQGKYSQDYSVLISANTDDENNTNSVVKFLLESDINVHVEDEVMSSTALQYADLIGSSFRVIALLLEFNANPKELICTKAKIKSCEQSLIERILSMAVEEGYAKLISFIIDCGISVNIPLPHGNRRVTKGHTTLLHRAIQLENLYIAQVLINKMRNIEATDSNGNTPLHIAADQCKLETVEFLVNRKFNIMQCNKRRETALHLAAKSGSLEIVQYLVAKGADVSALNINNLAPLHYAAMQDNLRLVEYLYECQGDQFFKEGSTTESTPLHIAVAKGKLNIVRFLANKVTDVDVCDKNGNTSLHETNIFRNSKIIRCLVDAGANINKKNIRGETVIFWAQESGGLELLNYLNEKGADFNIRNKEGETLLLFAIRNKNKQVCEYLLKLAVNKEIDITITNNKNDNALHLAVEHGDEDLALFLFKKFRKQLNTFNKNGETPLLHAAQHQKWDCVKKLKSVGANLYARNREGVTVLHKASEQGNISIIEWLLKQHFNITDTTVTGDSVLHFAAKSGAIESLQYLYKKHGNFNVSNNLGESVIHSAIQANQMQVIEFIMQKKFDVNVATHNGITPLHLAVTRSLDVVKKLIRRGALISLEDQSGCTPLHVVAKSEEVNINIVNFLIENGGDVNLLDKNNKSPLHYAIEIKNVELIHLFARNATSQNLNCALIIAVMTNVWQALPVLLKHGANINFCDFLGMTPLHRAAYLGDPDIVHYLLERNAEIDAQNCDKATPFHFAAFRGHVDIVKMLLGKCDYNSYSVINRKDKYGNTALHCAVFSDNLHLVQLLVSKGAKITLRNNKKDTPLEMALNMARTKPIIDYLRSLQKNRRL